MKRFVSVLCLVLICGAATAELSVPEFSDRTLNTEVEDDAFSDYLVVNAEDPQNTIDEVSENASGSTHVTNRSVADSSGDNRISADDIEVYSTDDTDTLTLNSVLENGSAEVSGRFDQNDSINYTAGKTINLTEQSPGNFTGTVEIGQPDSSKTLRADSGDSLSFSYFNGSERVTNAAVLDTQPPEFTGARQVSGREVVLDFSEDISGPSDDIDSGSVEFPNLDSAVPTDVSVSTESGSFAARARLNTTISTGRQPLTNFTSDLTDAAGNTATGTAVTASDKAPPQPGKVFSRDEDTDGRLDRVEIIASEQLDSARSPSQAFSVYQNSSLIETSAVTLDGNQVDLALKEEKVWTGTVEVEYSPEGSSPLRDPEGNEMDGFNQSSLDRASPVLVGALINASESSGSSTLIDLVFSERVRSEDGVDSTATVDGQNRDVNVSNGEARTRTGRALNMSSASSISSVEAVNDGRGNDAVAGNVRVRVFPNSSRTGSRADPVNLDQGWSLVSVPLDTSSRVRVKDVFRNSSKVGAVWRYTGGDWDVWTPEPGPTGFDYMQGELGYAVKADGRVELRPRLSAAESAESDISSQNWILAAGTEPYRQQASTSGAFSHLSTAKDVKRLRNGNVNESAAFVGRTAPGEGYWVKTEGDTPTGSFASSPSLRSFWRWLF